MIYAVSALTLPDLRQLVPGAELYIPSGSGLAKTPPFVVAIRGDDGANYSILKSIEDQGQPVIALPMPRNSATLNPVHITALKPYLPDVSTTDTMATLLGRIYALAPCDLFDPHIHCF